MVKKTKAHKSIAQASAKKTASTGSSKQRIYKATGKPITAKQEAFAREFAGFGAEKNKLNGTQSALDVYDTDSEVARRIATENMSKPVVASEIQSLLDENGMSLGECAKIAKRNMLQQKHLPTSQKALETNLKLHGVLNDDPKTQVNVALVIE